MENKADSGSNGFSLIMKYRYVIMGIATIWIFVFHTWIPVFNDTSNSFGLVLHNIEEYLRLIGYCGVDIFLLLSGMGLTYAIRKGTLVRFYYRRIRRVFLPYLAAALIRWPIDQWSVREFLENASGLSFYIKHIHTFCWFVPAIITLYLLFPLYYKFFSKAKSKLLFTSAALLIWFLLSIVVHGHMRFDLYGFTNRIPVFLIGIYFGELSKETEKISFTKKHYLAVIAALIAGLFLAYMYNFRGFEIILPGGKAVVPNILISVGVSFLVAKMIEMFDRSSPKFGKALNETLSFWGKMSLEMYCAFICFLIPYFVISVQLLHDLGLPIVLINIVVFSVTTSISWLVSLAFTFFWKLVELPKKKKIADNSKHEQQFCDQE